MMSMTRLWLSSLLKKLFSDLLSLAYKSAIDDTIDAFED